jgi:uncharacterized membrane protein YqjE
MSCEPIATLIAGVPFSDNDVLFLLVYLVGLLLLVVSVVMCISRSRMTSNMALMAFCLGLPGTVYRLSESIHWNYREPAIDFFSSIVPVASAIVYFIARKKRRTD